MPPVKHGSEGAAGAVAATGHHRCKTEDQAVATNHSVDRVRWQESVEGLTQRIAGRFARVEPRCGVRDLVLGLLSDLPRKNCRTIAEHVGHATPDGLQHLLERAKSDAHQVRDYLRDYVQDIWRTVRTRWSTRPAT